MKTTLKIPPSDLHPEGKSWEVTLPVFDSMEEITSLERMTRIEKTIAYLEYDRQVKAAAVQASVKGRDTSDPLSIAIILILTAIIILKALC